MVLAAEHFEADLLHGIGRAFASTFTYDEAGSATIRWVQVAVGDGLIAARVAVSDWEGRLRILAAQGGPHSVGRKRSARRREAFESRERRVINVGSPPGSSLAFLPLVDLGQAVGLLEVVAPSGLIRQRLGILETVASQAAIAISNIRRWVDMERGASAIGDVARVTKSLLGASSPDEAMRRVIRFCWDRFELPVAGWSTSGGDGLPALVGTCGLGSDRKKEMAGEIPRLPAAPFVTSKGELIALFEKTLGTDQIGILDVGDALVLVGGASGSVQVELDALASILVDVLSHLAEIARVHRTMEDLDVGLASAAHEIRGPLLGGEKAIELFLGDRDRSGDRQLLRLAQEDLRRLAATVEGLLRWSVGAGSLQRRQTDLVRLVNEVVESCSLEAEPGQIEVRLPEELSAQIDRTLIRAAIENVVRNAMIYGGREKVHVSAARTSGVATVTIRDEGPGVRSGDREAVFEPFIRGGGSHRHFPGRGLGLFIARRVVQAHGGTIRLESTGRGAAFHLDLPIGAA